MSTVEAVYQGGVFRPLDKIDLAENQHVRLSVQPIANGVDAWLTETRALHQEIIGRRGHFPDSTSDIAADRNRDE